MSNWGYVQRLKERWVWLGICWTGIWQSAGGLTSSVMEQYSTTNAVFMDGNLWFLHKQRTLNTPAPKGNCEGVDICHAVKGVFHREKGYLGKKLVSVKTDEAPAMMGRRAGFIAHFKGDTQFWRFLHDHCICHQQALCAKVIDFEHGMTPVVKQLTTEYGDPLWNPMAQQYCWLVQGFFLCYFWETSECSRKSKVKTPCCWRTQSGHLIWHL